jgi:ABC-type uncharacterized transport system permease subunit
VSSKPPRAEPDPSPQAEEYMLERYKYILQQIHTLNENHQKYLSLFQTLTTVIVTGIIAVFASWQQLQLEAETARTAIRGLTLLLTVLGLFVILSMVSGIIAWLDYRNEEAKLLDRVVHRGFRKRPSLRNFWYWQETYFILLVLIVTGVIYWYVETRLIPAIA